MEISEIKHKIGLNPLPVLTYFGAPPECLTGRATYCPACGGHDRFTYDNKSEKLSHICRGCGHGNDFDLVMKINNWDFATTAKELTVYFGGETSRPTPPVIPARVQPKTQDYARKLWNAANTDNPWEITSEVVGSHPYAVKKRLKGSFGAGRGTATGKLVGTNADCIMVPSRNTAGELIGLQCINAEGKKQSFGSLGFLILGNDLDTQITIVIIEGWASAAAWVQMHSGNACAVVAFSKGTQERVAREIQTLYPRHVVAIAEEDDA